MTNQIKWPTLRATAESHTVNVRGGLLAGFLIRDSASRVELGYVWSTGAGSARWAWRASDGEHYGERATQHAAIEVLRDTFDFLHRTSPLAYATQSKTRRAIAFELDDNSDTSTPEPKTAPARVAAPKSAPVVVVKPAHVQQIVWGADSGTDLRAAVARALAREK